MADFRMETVVVTTRRYVLDSPTNWAEVGKVFAVIKRDYPTKDFDDSVIVRAHDDEIHFVVEVETVVKNG